MRKIIITLILLFLSIHLFAEDAFGPWDPEVKIADENISLDSIEAKNTKVLNERIRPVYNGFKGGAWLLIVFFQKVISSQDGPNCRHIPTCSAYGKHAVEKHGALLGAILAGDRLLRCNPYYPPSEDPVPKKVFTK